MAKRRWRIILIAGGLTLIAAVVVTLALLVHPHTMLTANTARSDHPERLPRAG